MSFGRRRCCSLLTDPLRDMLWCPCGSTSRLASAQNPLPRMYSYFGDTTLALAQMSRVFQSFKRSKYLPARPAAAPIRADARMQPANFDPPTIF